MIFFTSKYFSKSKKLNAIIWRLYVICLYWLFALRNARRCFFFLHIRSNIHRRSCSHSRFYPCVKSMPARTIIFSNPNIWWIIFICPNILLFFTSLAFLIMNTMQIEHSSLISSFQIPLIDLDTTDTACTNVMAQMTTWKLAAPQIKPKWIIPPFSVAHLSLQFRIDRSPNNSTNKSSVFFVW